MTAPSVLDPAFLRGAWGRIVGVLVRTHRLADPALAEDAAQHAMLQALRQWPLTGMPTQPLAWLTAVARNHLRDHWRKVGREQAIEAQAAEPAALDEAPTVAAGELGDDELALLFACCDPELPVTSQVALALKVVCGFSLREIAAGLLSDEAALAQRLARARRTLAERKLPIVLPAGDELPPRLEGALNAIHLLFNEGFAASGGAQAQRPDLCREAIRLARSVAAHPATAHPDADALAALLLFHGARLTARIDAAGDWLLLAEQDRGLWDRSMIAAGFAHLQRVERASVLSAWHLRAGIAAEHAAAPDFPSTNWPAIVAQYELLLRLDGAPPTRLAHAIAMLQGKRLHEASSLLAELVPSLPQALHAYGRAALAEAARLLGRAAEAEVLLLEAAKSAPQPAARRLLERRLAELRSTLGPLHDAAG